MNKHILLAAVAGASLVSFAASAKTIDVYNRARSNDIAQTYHMQQRDMAPMKHEGNMMHDKNSMKHTAKAKKAHVKHRAHKMKEDVKEGAHKMNVKAKNAMHGDDTMENNGSK